MNRGNLVKIDNFRITTAIWNCKTIKELILLLRMMERYIPYLIPKEFIETSIKKAWDGDIVSIGMDCLYQVNWFKYPPVNFSNDVYIVTVIDLGNTAWIPNPNGTGIVWKYIRNKEWEDLANKVYGFTWDETNICYSLFHTLEIIKIIHEDEKSPSTPIKTFSS